MITKTIVAATVVLCAISFQPSASANDINISQLMSELIQKESVELQQQMKQNAHNWLQQMAQQVTQNLATTADVDTQIKTETKADVELVAKTKLADELGE